MKFVIANWKSHKNREEVERWLETFENKSMSLSPEYEVVLAPAFSHLMYVSNRLLARERHPRTSLAVQDLSPFPAGAYTGAVSVQNLQGYRVKYAIVGHSERRRHFHETHQDVANKVSQALESGIIPIVCVDHEYIADQAAAIDSPYLEKCIVAYEPLAAVGTGNNEPVEQVAETCQRIKTVFGEVRVIYGGSVNQENVREYLKITDGVLVGSASLDVDTFIRLLDK